METLKEIKDKIEVIDVESISKNMEIAKKRLTENYETITNILNRGYITANTDDEQKIVQELRDRLEEIKKVFEVTSKQVNDLKKETNKLKELL